MNYKRYTLDKVPEELKNTEEYSYILKTIEDKLDEDGLGFYLCDYVTFIDDNNNFRLGDCDGKPYCIFEGLDYYG